MGAAAVVVDLTFLELGVDNGAMSASSLSASFRFGATDDKEEVDDEIDDDADCSNMWARGAQGGGTVFSFRRLPLAGTWCLAERD